MKKKGVRAGESDEEAANIDGRAIMELGTLTWCKGKGKLPKKLGALMSAQDVEAVGLLRKKRKLLKRIENKRKMIESGKLD